MQTDTYRLLEDYMRACMQDSAHDQEHIYRVLFNALHIAETEENVDYDLLICACLLHDIGRQEQFRNPLLCHAEVGAEKAFRFLTENHFSAAFAEQIAHCILCHRYRGDRAPQTTEAKILFDADKLDAAGAIGIARTLIYKGQVAQPLYLLDTYGCVSDGSADQRPSFFQEYKHKLEKVYDHFYTRRGAELAKARQKAAAAYYEALLAEVSGGYTQGRLHLEKHLENSAKE